MNHTVAKADTAAKTASILTKSRIVGSSSE
jgi:hypothetical protein